MTKNSYVYIMTNKNRSTLYIGVTNDLCRRISEHKNHLLKKSFTDKYNLEYCIYYEEFQLFSSAIHREKELKKWNRQKKDDLINKKNPEWKELVTEKGFIKNFIPFSHMVNDFINELKIKEEIPPFGRNDNGQATKKGAGFGGIAAKPCPCSPGKESVIPNATQCSEESIEKKGGTT